MLGLSKGQRDLVAVTTVLKILLYPAYRSTDFEVHRNWLAITHNLPLRQWYHDTTSEWTLDYPPFFAYFSYLLTLPAHLLPSRLSNHLLELSAKPVEAWYITGYMRTSVLISEVVLLTGLLRLAKTSTEKSTAITIALALALHPGFLVLDSLHFQYNGFLFGITVWSLVGARENRPLLCASAFAALLNYKHIYIYLAPAWFIYLFRAYCMPPRTGSVLRLEPLMKIGAVTSSVLALSLGPFLMLGQGQQLLMRLFPFTRGLMHAYWAPNAWAGVTLVDRILLQVSKRLRTDLAVSAAGIASTSRGLVGDTHFAVLPDIKPIHCFILTGITQIVQLIPLWNRPNYKTFLQAIAACGFSSFMFGWHVHEKAVMLILVPLSLLSAENWEHYQAFIVASIAGIIGLFPLLFKPAETPIKMGYSLIWAVVVFSTLRTSVSNFVIDSIQTVYLATTPLLLLFTSVIHPALMLSGRTSEKSEFLPLMMTSVWCSIGLWIAWVRLVRSMWGRKIDVDIKID